MTSDSADLQRILDALPMLFFQKDLDNRIVRANAAAASALGTTVDDLAGAATEQWFPDEADDYRAADRVVINSGAPELGIVEQVQIDGGEKRWMQTDKFPLVGDDGSVEGVLVFVRDVSRRKAAADALGHLEAQLQHAQRVETIGVFAGAVAHDFNNLLGIILSNTEQALSLIDAGHEAGTSLRTVMQTAQQAARSCEQLLSYGGNRSPDLAPTNLSLVVREAETMLAEALDSPAILALDLADELPLVDIDQPSVTQLLMNLVNNSFEALPDTGGTITITTRLVAPVEDDAQPLLTIGAPLEEQAVALEVADVGHGMSAQTADAMFDPFFTTKSTGRGLGLATTLGTATAHRATIEIHSREGGGTTFRVLFPLHQSPAEDSAESHRPGLSPKPPKSGTILLVEDHDGVRVALAATIRALGYDVVSAATGPAALDVFAERAEHIVAAVLDVTMPGLSGPSTATQLRAITPGLPVVFASGFPMRRTELDVAPPPHVGFLQKPFTGEDLMKALHRAIEAARADDTNSL